jgi:hypothetical protein
MLTDISQLYDFRIHSKEVIKLAKKGGEKKSGSKDTKDKTQKKNQKGNTVG